MKKKKLTLKKEQVSSLSSTELKQVQGGVQAGSAGSSYHNFTCCWCSQGGTDTGDSSPLYTCPSGGQLTCIQCPPTGGTY